MFKNIVVNVLSLRPTSGTVFPCILFEICTSHLASISSHGITHASLNWTFWTSLDDLVIEPTPSHGSIIINLEFVDLPCCLKVYQPLCSAARPVIVRRQIDLGFCSIIKPNFLDFKETSSYWSVPHISVFFLCPSLSQLISKPCITCVDSSVYDCDWFTRFCPKQK